MFDRNYTNKLRKEIDEADEYRLLDEGETRQLCDQAADHNEFVEFFKGIKRKQPQIRGGYGYGCVGKEILSETDKGFNKLLDIITKKLKEQHGEEL